MFSVICAPSEESKEIGRERDKFAESHRKRIEFWKGLLERSREKTELFSNVSPSKDHWISARSGRSGIWYNYVIGKSWARVELQIDRGSEEVNKKIFDSFYKNKEEIESKFGDTLIWDYKEGRRSCYIRWKYEGLGLKDEEKWDTLQDKMVDAMMRLEKTFRDAIRELAI